MGLALRLAVPRGIWLDEAISIHQARLSLHDLFRNLYNGDRQPPLYHLTLWLTIRAFGHSEFAVRLPSLIAGTLVIPALYELGRELYDRRTGLIAAAFAAVSPLLIWYSQEVRMYEFAALFGLLALLTQLRAIRNGTMLQLGRVHPRHRRAAVVALLRPAPDRRAAARLRRRPRSTASAAGEPVKPLALGFAYSVAVLVMQLVPLAIVRAPPVPGHHRRGRLAERNLRPTCRSTRCSRTWPGRSGATSPTRRPCCWRRCGRCSCSARWSCWAAAGRARRWASPPRRSLLVVLLIVVSAFDRSFFEVRNFLILVPLVLLLIARLITGWIRQPRARLLVAGGVVLTLLIGLADQQLNKSNPRLFDFRGAIEDIKANAGPNSLVLYEPSDMRYVLEYYAPDLRGQPLSGA